MKHLFSKILKRIYINTIYKIYRIIINYNYRKKLKNRNFSIISSNCLAGVMYHDLGHEFLSPTINLFIHAPCFVKMLKNLEFYMSLDIVELKENSKYLNRKANYPIGVINNEIEIHFLHYKTFEEARLKWNIRRKRINYSNLFVTLTDQDACTAEVIQEFDNLEIKNKVFFSAHYYPNVNCLVWCKNYAQKEKLDAYFTELRGYEKYFNLIKWINNGN